MVETVAKFANHLYEQAQTQTSGWSQVSQHFWQLAEVQGLEWLDRLQAMLQTDEAVERFTRLDIDLRLHCLRAIDHAPLCLHGRESINRILQQPAFLTPQAAGTLSQYQDAASLIYLFEAASSNPRYQDFLQWVYGDCLFRQTNIVTVPAIQQFFQTYMWDYWSRALPNHIMATLESQVLLFNYGRDGGCSLPAPPSVFEGEDERNEIPIQPAPQWRDRIQECDPDPIMGAAVADWVERSNGDCYLWHCLYPSGANDRQVLAAMVAHNLPCCPASEAPFFAKEVTVAQVFAQLFHAASSAYTYCQWGNLAQVRLRAWQSLAAMMGCNWQEGYDAITPKLSQTHWFSLNPLTSSWFSQELDLWLVCLNQANNCASAIAATDWN